MDKFFEDLNFPYSSVRRGQDEFIRQVYKSIKENKNIMVNAPTGLGKTVSGLAPALKIAKEKGLTVVCLTSRQTQANQIIKTVKDLNSKSKEPINYVAYIGKRSMCVHPERDLYPPSDFNEFCKKMRESGKCKYFKNAKNTENEEQIKAIIDETSKSFMSVEGFVDMAGLNNYCPYELAGVKAFQSDLVVCDFNYMFSSGIREGFLGKIGRELKDCILIVDEAHNLPDRIRNSYSHALNTELIKNALKELGDFIKSSKYDAYIENIKLTLEEIYFEKKNFSDKEEYKVTRKEFSDFYLSKFRGDVNIVNIVDELREVEALVKEERVVSFVGRVANFLEMWEEIDDDSYLRTIEKIVRDGMTHISLRARCIDPSDISSEVVNNTYSTIFMSGTLTPIAMYRDVLGVANTNLLELSSPFAREKQLTLVIDDVTSKYSARSIDMYKKIGNHIENLLSGVFGRNAIIFFPGYDFMDKVVNNINLVGLHRKILKEQRYMTKEQKEKFVEDFKGNGMDTKAKVLFAVTSGSFAEGLDLPNKALEMVVVVGLPLGVPDLFTNALIEHYEKKFRKGQMYGYVYPAMSKIIQAAGRCIRTEEDKGVVALLDNRFLWTLYAQCFPIDWKFKKSKDYKLDIMNFFD